MSEADENQADVAAAPRQRALVPLAWRQRVLAVRSVLQRPRWALGFEILKWALFIGSLAAIFGPALLAHMERSASYAADDARQQVFPFFRYSEPGLFEKDYIADYFLANLPLGHRVLYTIAGWFGAATALSKALPYLILAVTLTAIGLTAGRFAGKLGAWIVLAICLGMGGYLGRMAGGLPRGFGFPVVACALAALAYGRIRALAAVVVIGAGFYPATALLAGLTLPLVLLVLPAADRGQAVDWSFRRRVAFVAATALAASLVLAPSMILGRGFGPIITAGQTREFPEAGPGGRYGSNDRAPFPGFFAASSGMWASSLIGHGEPWSPELRQWIQEGGSRKSFSPRLVAFLELVFLISTSGWLILAARRSSARRVLVLLFSAFCAHLIARFIAPYFYLPQRYVLYTVPLLASLIVATGVAGFFAVRERRRPWLERSAVAVFGLTVLLVLGGRGNTTAGLNVPEAHAAPIYKGIAALPVNSLIAGWPRGPLDNVPYLTKRSAFVTYETHQAFHAGFAREMRRRMKALIDAYFATSLAPVLRLRDDFGVTHLLVHLPHLRGRTPRYFAPFNGWIARATRDRRARDYELPKWLESATVFRSGHDVLLDLRRIGPEPKLSATDRNEQHDQRQ